MDSATRSLDAETAPRNVTNFLHLFFLFKEAGILFLCYSESERQRRSLTLAEKRRRNETLAVGMHGLNIFIDTKAFVIFLR